MKLFYHLRKLVKINLSLILIKISNDKKITKSIEIIYGLRNFIGNANKYTKKHIYKS